MASESDFGLSAVAVLAELPETAAGRTAASTVRRFTPAFGFVVVEPELPDLACGAGAFAGGVFPRENGLRKGL